MSIYAHRRMFTPAGARLERAAFSAAGAGEVAAGGCGVLDGKVTLAPLVETLDGNVPTAPFVDTHTRADVDRVFVAVHERRITRRAVLVP